MAPSIEPIAAPRFKPALVACLTPSFIPCFNACAPNVPAPKVVIPTKVDGSVAIPFKAYK